MTAIFKTLHPYERKLIEIQNSYDLPPPPPEFLRLIRDRAELKAKCLLFQADQNKQLHLLSTDQEQVSKFENSKFSAEQYFGLEFPFLWLLGLILNQSKDDYGFSRPMDTRQRRSSPPPYRPAYQNYPPAHPRDPAYNRGNDF